MLVKGTFEYLTIVAQEKRTAVFNVLDIPLGRSLGVDVPPGFFQLASEEYAHTATQSLVKEAVDFRDDLVWLTAANTHAVSWFHVDDDGLCTSTCTLAGSKVWAIATPLAPDREVGSIHAFRGNEPADFEDHEFRVELLHLPPNCVLCVSVFLSL